MMGTCDHQSMQMALASKLFAIHVVTGLNEKKWGKRGSL